LWDIIGDDEKTMPTDPKEKKKREIKEGKAMYVLFVIVEDEFLYRIKNYKMPSDAWVILETLFTKKNEDKLHQLENELMSIRDKMIRQYFIKVKSLHDKIQKIGAESAISEARMCPIVIRGFDPKYSGLVTATQG